MTPTSTLHKPSDLDSVLSYQAHLDLEQIELNLGFVPLLDSAPLIVAYERGYFAQQGLDVRLKSEHSWSTIRDKVSFGLLDGAQMLAPMPLAASLGLGSITTPMMTALSLGLNGNAITLSNTLWQALQPSETQASDTAANVTLMALKQHIAQRKNQGLPILKMGIVYPFSQHNYLLRYWLSSADIDPDTEVSLSVIAPTRMIQSLKDGVIDGFCVGEPWNLVAEQLQLGHTVMSSYEVWPNAPEKVFGVTQQWAEQNPNTHQAVIIALLQAAIWLDKPENRAETVALLARPEYLHLQSIEQLLLMSQQRWPLFFQCDATYPWHSHAHWLLKQMQHWQQCPNLVDAQLFVDQVYRPDLYHSAAVQLGLPIPV